MDNESAENLAFAIKSIRHVLGRADYADGTIAEQIGALASATEKVAEAIGRVADAIEGKK